jgi:oligopeptide transport system substrate-binding protein
MQQNRTQWLIALGVLVGLCVVTLLCVVVVGGYSFLNLRGDSTTVQDADDPQNPGSSETIPSSQTRGSNELVVPGADPPTLDPALASDATSANYIVELFSGLVTLDPELNIAPDLAEEWEVSDDGLTYTFTLRENVTFADGGAITAEDFKYSIERACDPETLSPVADTYLGDIVGCREKLLNEADEVSGVQVVDDQTLTIQIDEPKVYFLYKLTYPTAFVVDQGTIEREGRLWASETPNGSGPFQLETYSFGEQMVLVPNERYYGDPKPSVERVTFILSGGSGMTMYETDEIDVIGVGPADLDRVLDPSSELNADVQESESYSIGYIGLNANEPPFDDPLVRQAFNLAVDKETLIEVVVQDIVSPAYGIVPPGLPGANPDIEGLRFDPERARELLEQSTYGGPEGLPDITLHVSGGGGATGPEIEAMVEMWRENLGVEVAIEQTEWATFLFDLSRRPNPYQAYSVGWVADYPDPQNFLDVLFHCESLENKSGYCNPEVDALLEEARVEQDEARRMELYQQAEEIVVQEAAWVPLWFNRGYVLVKPWVKNYLLPPAIISKLKYVEIQQ